MERLWPPFDKPADCAGCPLATKGSRFVPGYGRLTSTLINIGEEPGPCETGDCECAPLAHPRGQPFVGKSGRKMDVGLGGSREGVFFTNVRKCRFDGEETKEEKAASIDHCVRAYLQKEMAAINVAHRAAGIKQAVVLTIGADATRAVFGRGNMSKMHGTCWTKAERDRMAAVTEQPAPAEPDDEEPPF